jgi:hypothetical protein
MTMGLSYLLVGSMNILWLTHALKTRPKLISAYYIGATCGRKSHLAWLPRNLQEECWNTSG